jgi:hypothetical protein
MAMGVVPLVIYLLCFLASLACAGLLFRGYRISGTRLLLWCGLCFAFLSINNLVVMLDVLNPGGDLRLYRNTASLMAVGALIFGLVWESE